MNTDIDTMNETGEEKEILSRKVETDWRLDFQYQGSAVDKAAREPYMAPDLLFDGPDVSVEPRARFFCRAIIKAGGLPFASCEGHPGGFYIAFLADLELAKRICNAGYFGVHLESRNSGQYQFKESTDKRTCWTLDLINNERGTNRVSGTYSEIDRDSILVAASEAWEEAGLRCF